MKDQFQKELLEKIKPGVKASDLKKPKNSQIPTPPSSPLIEPIKPKPTKPDQNLLDLQNQINSLQNQLQLYKDFKEADLKIKEKLKQELAEKDKTIKELQQNNTLLNKTIANLKNHPKSKAKPQPEAQSEKHYLFTCSICDQNKRSQLHLAKVNGLGIDPTKTQKICDYCIKKVDLIQEKEEFF